MSLKLSAEQIELQRTIRGFFAKHLTPAYLRTRIQNGFLPDPDFWKGLDALGLFGYFSSLDAEMCPTVRDLAILAFECGRALCPHNVLETILGGAFLFSITPDLNLSQETIKQFREACRTADVRVAIVPEKLLRDNSLTISKKAAKFQIDGEISLINRSANLDYIILPITVAPNESLHGTYLIDLKTSDKNKYSASSLPCLDLTIDLCAVKFSSFEVIRLTQVDPKNLRALHETIKASELAGLCAKVVELTTEYVKVRKQFKVPIGGFQAVQHRLSEMYLLSEAMRALSDFAAWSLESSQQQGALACSAAIAFATEHAAEVVEGAIQLHGGIGFTWEFDLHLYLRRAKFVEMVFGRTEADYLGIVEDVLRSANK